MKLKECWPFIVSSTETWVSFAKSVSIAFSHISFFKTFFVFVYISGVSTPLKSTEIDIDIEKYF